MVGSRQRTFRRMDLRGQSEQPVGPVATDGDRTRYQGGTYDLYVRRAGAMRQLGWYRRIRSLVPIWDKAFLFSGKEFFDETQHQTMAGPERNRD